MHSRCLDAIKANIDIHIGAFLVRSSRRSSIVMCCSAMQMATLMSSKVVTIY